MKAWMYKNEAEVIIVISDYKETAMVLIEEIRESWYQPDIYKHLVCLGEVENESKLYHSTQQWQKR